MAASSAVGTRGQLQFSALEAPDMGADETALSNQTAELGTRRVGTTAERNALSGAKLFEGLEWFDTTLGYRFTYRAGGWSPTGGAVLLASASPVTTPTPAPGAYGLVASMTFSSTAPQRIEIVYSMIAQSSGISAGFIRVKLNNTILGIPQRVTNLSQANAPVGIGKVSKGVTIAGTNTILVEGIAEGTTWFANSPQFEVWAA